MKLNKSKGTIHSIILSFIFFIVINPFQISYAAMAPKTSLSDHINSADLIVQGVFSSVNSAWQGKKIVTEGKVNISLVIKGEDLTHVIVKWMGGTANHPKLNSPVSMNISTGVKFKKGDEAILFLTKISDQHYIIKGMSKGVFKITFNPQTGHKMISKNIKKIHITPTKNSDIATITGQKMTLDELIEFIQSRIKSIK